MGGFHYTASSRYGCECGTRLLDLTSDYERGVLPPDTRIEIVGMVGLVAQARYLLRVAYFLADHGHDAPCAILIRSITEGLFTLAWIDIDPQLAYRVWALDELRQLLNQHREVADDERRYRQRLRRAGKQVPPTPPSHTLGILTRASLTHYRLQQATIEADIRALARLSRRMKRLQVDRVARMPSVEQRAKAVRLGHIYSLAYRFDSRSATHPSPLAINQYIEERPEGIRIREAPAATRPDPYVTGAVLLGMILEVGGKHVDHTAIEGELVSIKDDLLALSFD